MVILSHTGGLAMTNCYLVADETAKVAVLFDAPDNTVAPLLAEAKKRGWDVTGLWLTHGHFDHFADHAVLREQFPNARVLIHPSDEPKVRHPEKQVRMFGLPLQIPPLSPDGHVADNQKLKLGSLDALVLHTPGHSSGHVMYYFPAEKLLIGGDLIIGGAVGRTDLPDSDQETLEASVRRIMSLPDDTRLLGGHGDATTLGLERANNYYVQDALKRG
jgi:glyoxylase-like metal-dependent hydrolase (beta-lactamase superfamily II)